MVATEHVDLHDSPMRRTGLAALVSLALAGLSFASSGCASSSRASAAGSNSMGPSGLTGNYTTTVRSRAFGGTLTGTWKLHLEPTTYSFNYTGQTAKNVIISGTYSVAGHTITLTDRTAACSSKDPGGCRFIGCRGAGTYRIAHTNHTLSFTVVGDPCKARRAVLAGKFS